MLAFCGAALAPPAAGLLWLVPAGARARVALPALAVGGGARLVARGPIAGSVIVRGDRAALWRPMLAHGILTLAAPAAACGGVDPSPPAEAGA